MFLKRSTVALALGLSILCGVPLWAGSGTTTCSFLNIVPGAEAQAMGNSIVATVNDASAFFWNPAATTFMSRKGVFLSHKEWISSAKFDAASFILPVGDHRIGIGGTFFSISDIPITFDSPDSLSSFSSYSFAVGLHYAYLIPLFDRQFSVGGNFKLIKEDVYERSLVGWAGDLGFLFYRKREEVTVGLTLNNLGPKVKFSGQLQSEPLPATLKFGIGNKLLLKKAMTLALALDYPFGGNIAFNFGASYKYDFKRFRVEARTGYSYRMNDAVKSFADGLKGGVGVTWRNFSLDYSIMTFHMFEGIHDFSFGIRL